MKRAHTRLETREAVTDVSYLFRVQGRTHQTLFSVDGITSSAGVEQDAQSCHNQRRRICSASAYQASAERTRDEEERGGRGVNTEYSV